MFKSERERVAYVAKIKECQTNGRGRAMLQDVRTGYKCCNMCKAYTCEIIGRNTSSK